MGLAWSKGRIAAAVGVSAVVAAIGASYVWGPQWARQTAVEQLSQLLGRRVTLDAAELSLLQLKAGLRGLTIYEADGQSPFVKLGHAQVQLSLASLRHLAPVVESVQIDSPTVHLSRLDAQRWNFSDIAARLAAKPSQPPSGEPARFSVNNIALTQGDIVWEDQVSHTRHELSELRVALPFISNLPYVAEQFTTPSLSARLDGTLFKLDAKTRPFAKSRDAILNIELDGLALASFVPLSPVQVEAKLEQGKLDAKLALSFKQDDKGSSLHLSGQAALRDLSVVDAQDDALIKWQALRVTLADSQPLLNQWAISQVQWDKPALWLERDRHGQLALVDAFKPRKQTEAQGKPVQPQTSGSQSASPTNTQFKLARFEIHDGEVHWVDGQVPDKEAPRAQDVTDLNLSVSDVAMVNGQFADKAVPVKLAARHNGHGELSVDGMVNLPHPGKDKGPEQALSAQLALVVKAVELTAFQPYVADQLNVALTRGELNADGQLSATLPARQPPVLRFDGNASVQGLRSVDKAGGDDFVRWKTLAFKTLKLRLNEQAAANPLDLGIGEIALDDFYARVIVKPTGRLNLQDIVKTAAAEPSGVPSGSPAASAATDKGVASTRSSNEPRPRIAIGRIVMKGGRMNFSDNFIKPNYAANLTDLDGTVSALASDKAAPADLNFKGRIDHDSPLSISGKVNPLAPQLYLQIATRATDIELTRLTPYAAKYAGYPITKGKLSLDLKYLIDNGKLDAQNQVFVNQLTFGEQVDSPDALKLPVLFAISLLTNSKGEMDVNLPISGTLSDPDFSVGGLVWRVVLNLVGKAVTAPFSLMASAFGGGEELGYVTFPPGSAELSAEAKGKLDTLAKVLLDRPSVKMEIAGRVDPTTEQDGARRAYVANRVKAQKVADLVKLGQAANSDQVIVSTQEYPKYLERAYRAEPFDKPASAQALTTVDMEKAMLQHAQMDEAWFKGMADARALAVKKYLDESGHVPVERLFLVASHLNADGIKDQAAPQRADFTLAN